MKIHGIQKTTLLDYPGHLAATIFLGGCNFRCPYCHNSSLLSPAPHDAFISKAEVLSYLKKRKGVLEGVCITGGEPTIHNELIPFIEEIHAMGYQIKLDTNGSHPHILSDLCKKKLINYIAMDIKSSPENYSVLCGSSIVSMKEIDASVSYLMEGHVAYEFRTTVVQGLHSESDFFSIGEWLKNCSAYFLQPFRNNEQVLTSGLNPPSSSEMKSYIQILSNFMNHIEVRGMDSY